MDQLSSGHQFYQIQSDQIDAKHITCFSNLIWLPNRLRSGLKKTEHDKTSELQLEGDEEIMQKDRGLDHQKNQSTVHRKVIN